jgi:hypothetical protein
MSDGGAAAIITQEGSKIATFPIVKGLRLRATKVNNCGLPQSGPANRVVTDGYVSATISPVFQEAEELEQRNAEGRVCVQERTPPERKYYNLTFVLCNVNTCLITLFSAWAQELDWEGNAVGFRDQRRVESDFGVALELWTGGRAANDCDVPTTDDVFAQTGSGRDYGYLLTWGTEFVLGDVEIGAQVSTLTLTGISFAAPQWGRGPYNVVPIDGSGTAGRLLTPVGEDEQLIVQRTSVEPPEVTPGSECCPVDIAGTFTDPNFYFGGPDGEPAADVAPNQPLCGDFETQTVTITGSPTGGTFTLTYDGQTTAPIAYNASAADVQSALESLSNLGSGAVQVSGSAGGPYSIDIVGTGVPALTASGTGLTGGTDPDVVVS